MAWLYLTLIFATGVLAQLEPCKNYKSIDDRLRSTGYKPLPDDKLLCDRRMRPGWYRFTSKAGGTMPEMCPAQFTCGTHAPIWLNGKHPTVKEGIVSREACVNMPTVDPKYKCCGLKLPISIKNCHKFYVYQLVRVPGCSMAYCAGDASPCPSGTFSATGFTPGCKEAYPRLTTAPLLKGPKINKQKTAFSFPCEIPFDVTRTDVEFEVVWLFDHAESAKVHVPPTIVKGSDRIAYLESKYLLGNMQKSVSCKVRSYFPNTPQRKSDFKESNGYWAGITVDPLRIELSEKQDQEVEITIKSTVPILCDKDFRNTACGIDIELDIEGNSFEDIVAAEECVKRITTTDWDPKTQTAQVSHKVMATRDFIRDGDRKTVVKFRPVFSLSPNIFHGVELPDVQILTKDTDTQKCSGTGDPHFTGFDRKKAYHLYSVGEYTLYKSKSRHFEVQVRTWTCWKVSCICGVAVREGNDVIHVDMCHGRSGNSYPRVSVKSQNKLLEGTLIKRDKSGKQFVIYLPSGASVKAQIAAWGMNVHVQAPSDDFDDTEGICGNFNGNDKDDFTAPNGQVVDPHTNNKPNRFFESWRQKPGASLFDKIPATNPNFTHNPKYCKCAKDKKVIDCTFGGKVQDPAKKVNRFQDITGQLNKKNRVGRSTAYHDYDTDVETTYTFNYGNGASPATPNWPTASGWTQVRATAFCRAAINNSTTSRLCTKNGIDSTEFISNCVEDIKISDDIAFAIAARTSLEEACQEVVLKDPKNYVKDTNGVEQPPAFITTYTCPNDCSMKGMCDKGKCICNEGFTGEDCTVNKNRPPTIVQIQRGGICDIRKRPCESAWLVADNLLNTNALTCRVRDVEIINGVPHASLSSYRVPATFENFREVACQLPKSRVRIGKASSIGHMLSVSNNGIHFSKEILFVVHDSQCMNCNEKGLCNQKPRTCLIDGKCYAHGAKHPVEDRKYCNAEMTADVWSEISTTTATTTEVHTTTPPMTAKPTEAPTTFPSDWAPKGGKVQWRWDIWTLTETGCLCNFDHSRKDCGCCDMGGCQCSEAFLAQCVKCGDASSCGTTKPAPENGVDAWTSSFKGCPCHFDPSRTDCACCQNLGCPCEASQKNQCVTCGHPEHCGKKPQVFGPPY